MIIFSRKKNEGFVINHNITVTVIDIGLEKIRLGITAPREVIFHRQEVYDAIYGKGENIPNPAPCSLDPTLELGDRQKAFLSGIISQFKEKTGLPLTPDILVQTILDAVEEKGLDLTRAKSLGELKDLLRRG